MAAPGDKTTPSCPTLQEQLLGVIGYAGLKITGEVRRLASQLEKEALACGEGIR